jgi:hypothetical protein
MTDVNIDAAAVRTTRVPVPAAGVHRLHCGTAEDAKAAGNG